MNRFAKGLVALQDPKNEPIKWLLGTALAGQASATVGSHFLLDALAQPVRSSMLVKWNVYIHQFRELLVNADRAREKASNDLKAGSKDAKEKLVAFMAEVMAVIYLNKLGYEGFEVLLPTGKATPDFEARLNGKRVRVEVKNLREPQDRVRTVAAKHWKDLVEKDPRKYNFRVSLRHSCRGPLSKAAKRSLCTIIDQLPDMKRNRITRLLDGDVKILIEKFVDPRAQCPPGEEWLLQRLGSGFSQNQMVVVSSVGKGEFALDVDELQCLLLKALGRVVDSSHQFFSEESFCPECMNVIALRWEPPDVFFSPDMLSYTQEKIENFFIDFKLQLKPIIFCDPEIQWELVDRYR